VGDDRTSEAAVTLGDDKHQTSTSLEATPPSRRHEPHRSHRPSLDTCAAFQSDHCGTTDSTDQQDRSLWNYKQHRSTSQITVELQTAQINKSDHCGTTDSTDKQVRS